MEWIIRDICNSVDEAKQNLAKKAILFLQPLYKFEIKDFNYYRLYFAEAHCVVESENYVAAKEGRLKVGNLVDFQVNEATDECMTPTGAEFEIPSSLASPPPPKKRRPFPLNLPASSSSSKPTILITNNLATLNKV